MVQNTIIPAYKIFPHQVHRTKRNIEKEIETDMKTNNPRRDLAPGVGLKTANRDTRSHIFAIQRFWPG